MNAPLSQLQLRAPWQALLDGPAGDAPAAFHMAWMECLAHGAGEVSEAVLVLMDTVGDPSGGTMRPVAFWPAAKPCSAALAGLCEEALAMRMPMARNAAAAGGASMLAMPLVAQDNLRGVVALAFKSVTVPRHAQDWVRWGSGWLHSVGGDEGSQDREALQERLLLALDLIMTATGESDAKAAMNAVVTQAAVKLGCDRVSIGFASGGGRAVKLAAISNSADFSRRLDLARALQAAMNEACDQGASLLVKDGALAVGHGSPYAIVRDHAALTRTFGTRCALSVPFFIDKKRYGVLLYEWAEPEVDITRREVAMGATPVLGRLLLDKRHAQRAWPVRLFDGFVSQAGRLLGPRYVLRKLVVLGLIAAGFYLATATGEYRVPAKAALEGGVRRVVAAPFDGFVASAMVRAGQEVKKGQVLASLDDRDMKLEADRWGSQQAQFARQMNDAQAQHNLAQMQIAQAQARQAAAQRRLSESQAGRARVEAPFDGIIVSGDLSQSLGSAVKKGQSLFEIAPLSSYRIVMEVEEADIGQVREGQKGELMVTALPGRPFPFTVTLVTPVARANEGRNHFRVEASLDENAARLRPGMEGIGKIGIEERKRVWIWTHRMTDWARLQIWNWLGV